MSPNEPLVTEELPWGDKRGGFQCLGEDIPEGVRVLRLSNGAIPSPGPA